MLESVPDCARVEVMGRNAKKTIAKNLKAGQDFYLTTDISGAFGPVRGRKPPKADNESPKLRINTV